MGSISLSHSGAFQNSERRLRLMTSGAITSALDKYGQLGSHVLANATPQDTGDTRGSWYHQVKKVGRGYTIEWRNRNVAANGTPIAIMIQFGHGTGTGGYVAGKDYINPAIKPVFDLIIAEIRQKVTR